VDPVVWQPPKKFQDRDWLHVLLFLLTIASTTLEWGWAYSATLLAILGCHELGHYIACRHYDVDASLPYFLPIPPHLSLSGTLGAFIRIREPIPYKRWLFDIGIAGPIAGFVIAVPALFIGIAMSHFEPFRNTQGVLLGDPLLVKFFSWVIWGAPPGSEILVLHPIGLGAWFGLLVTALNLFPIGQLDGGHVSYTVFGKRSTYVTIGMIVVAIFLSYQSATWIVWTIVVTGMLFAFGVQHPRVLDEDVPLDARRKALAVFALVMFVLCFTPVPVEEIFKGR
jgi:membrane-associated protease RseP (regulator of RpoE activity)